MISFCSPLLPTLILLLERVLPLEDNFGFQSGDIVTAVNGLALSDAINTLKLYQTMKDATQASFDIERDGGTVTVSVDLASP